ncbi:MAG: hypothetical protein R3B13_12680 [Polyangiaceae bacterium]
MEPRFPDVPGAKPKSEAADASASPGAPDVPDTAGLLGAPNAPDMAESPDAPNAPGADPNAHRPPAPKPSKRRKLLVTAAGVAAVALGVGLAITAWRLYPWLKGPAASPAEIDARWSKVEGWARVDGAEASDDLDRIAAKATRFKLPRGEERVPRLDPDQVSADEHEAVQQLTAWQRKGAPYAVGSCDSSSPQRVSIPLFRLGQLTLFTATGEAELAQVEAVLALAQRMRQRGTLVELAVGSALAKLASEWSHARSTPLPASFTRYRPEVPEIHASLARDAVCVMQMAGSPGALGFETPLLGSGERGRPPFGIVSASREVSVYKDYQGRLLEQSFAVRTNWQQVAEVYEGADADRPKSLLLEALALHANIIRRTGKEFDEYQPLTK